MTETETQREKQKSRRRAMNNDDKNTGSVTRQQCKCMNERKE